MDQALNRSEIDDKLLQLGNKWKILDYKKIEYEFRFNNFDDAMKFVDKIAEIAEEESHYPNMCIDYNKVKVVLWTHAVDGLSEKDFILANKIENLLLKPY